MLFLKNVNFYILLFLTSYIFNFSFLYSNEPYGDNFQALKKQYLGENDKFLNNAKIKIIIQDEVEESHEVSMIVKIPKTLKDTNQIVILVDDNPIQLVTKIFPQKPLKSVGFNIRMEQDSYVRAALLDENEIWNISSKK